MNVKAGKSLEKDKQLSVLQAKVNSMEMQVKQLSILQAKVDSLETQVDRQDNTITDKNSKLDMMNSRIAQLETDLAQKKADHHNEIQDISGVLDLMKDELDKF